MQWLAIIGNVCCVGVDIAIACSMAYLLRLHRGGLTEYDAP